MPVPPPLQVPTPLLPDYDGACLSTLVPALLSVATDRGDRAGVTPVWLPAAARQAHQIVLLVLDGLGWEQLCSRRDEAPTLVSAEGFDRPITSVAPTTTACALASIATGRPPSDHGLIGYRLGATGDEIMNVLRWTLGSRPPRDARRLVPAAAYQPFRPFPGASHPVPVVSKSEFGGTGFTAAHLGDSPLHGYKVASSIAVEVAGLVAGGEPFVYAYYDGIDKVAHEHGLGRHYDAELRTVDRLVADIAGALPSGATLVVTADHGQVDVGARVELLGSELMAGTRFLSGEGRFRWLHARPGAGGDLLATASERYAGSTWVVPRQQMLDEGWFGGTLRARVVDRLGDVALVPYAPIAFLDPADTGETGLVARHGSLTPAEMLVPLLAVPGDGNIGG
ncbi:MAG: alkaline phosphatase family protein [Acidimicrobiales bacterium]